METEGEKKGKEANKAKIVVEDSISWGRFVFEGVVFLREVGSKAFSENKEKSYGARGLKRKGNVRKKNKTAARTTRGAEEELTELWGHLRAQLSFEDPWCMVAPVYVLIWFLQQ